MSEFVSRFDEPKISPIDYIKLMYEYTDEDGVMFIPGWYYCGEKQHSLRCKIKWNKTDLENIVEEYEDLEYKIVKMARIYREAENDVSHIKELLTDSSLLRVYNTYFRSFVYEKVSDERLQEIADKIDTINNINELEHRMWSDEQIEDYEKRYYNEYKNLDLSRRELDVYSDYERALYKNYEERTGHALGAIDLVTRVRRLCKLIEIKAPKIIANNEACCLASALVVNRFAASMEKVSEKTRLDAERFNLMSEEEKEEYLLDCLYRPKKKNKRKHNLNLFLYLILKSKTDVEHHISQSEILKILHNEYELDVERKALSRAIHDIEDEQLGIFSDPRGGTWYDPSSDRHDCTE